MLPLACKLMNAHTPGVESNEGEPSPRRPSRRWWAWLRLVSMGTALAVATGIVLARPLLPTGQETLKEGEVAPEDVRAPRSVTYESAILRAEEQKWAAAQVEPIYVLPNPALARQQLDRARQVLDYLGSVRADTLASPAQKRGWILAVSELADLSPETSDDLVTLPNESWDRVQLETLAVLDQAMRREIREGHVGEARAGIPPLVSLDLSEEEAAATVALARCFLTPNSFLDSDATAEAQARARDEVGPVLRHFEAGQVIVREGSRVEPLHLEALDQLGLQKSEVKWADFAGVILLAVVDTLLLGFYLTRFQPDVLWDGQKLLLLVLLTAGFTVMAGRMVPGSAALRYLVPAPALAMLTTASLGPHAGVITAIFLGAAAGAVADNSLEMAAFVTLGGLVATLAMERVERIATLFRAGLLAALVHVVVIFVFRFPQDTTQLGTSLIPVLVGAINGGVSASLALGVLFLIGPLFDITTTMRLVELSRPDNPLLQRILREAPATYHHSLMVANMAEQAAESIGADSLLARVGAYYHDAGKIARPYFFTENQAEGMNPHDRLDPHTSAEIIIDHVNDGLALARRYRLPRRVRAFIPEHHGTGRASFLYSRAVQLAGGDTEVDEKDFRYPGPKPQSRETALVMLADGCEAAVRSARPNSAEELAEIVDRIVAARVDDGQLNESGLTLRDLEVIRRIFTSSLKGVYHPRIQYPQSSARR